MNLILEQIFLTMLSEQTAFASVPLHLGTSADKVDPELACCVIAVQDCKHIVGGLWKATAVFHLETPAYTDNLATHTTCSTALQTWVEDTTAFKSSFSSSTLLLSGYKIEDMKTNVDGNKWITELSLTVGVDTSL